MASTATAAASRFPAPCVPAPGVPALGVPPFGVLPSAVATSPCNVGCAGVDNLHGLYVEMGLPSAVPSTAATTAVPPTSTVPPVAAMLVLNDLDRYRDGQWDGQQLWRKDLGQDAKLGELLDLLLVVKVMTSAHFFHDERQQHHESQEQGEARC